MKNNFLIDLGWANIGQSFEMAEKPTAIENEGATHHVTLEGGKWICHPLWTSDNRGQLVLHALFFQSRRHQEVLRLKEKYSTRLAKAWGV